MNRDDEHAGQAEDERQQDERDDLRRRVDYGRDDNVKR